MLHNVKIFRHNVFIKVTDLYMIKPVLKCDNKITKSLEISYNRYG